MNCFLSMRGGCAWVVRLKGKRKMDYARTISNDEYRMMNDDGDWRVGKLVRPEGFEPPTLSSVG
jgi:hypothetical protein